MVYRLFLIFVLVASGSQTASSQSADSSDARSYLPIDVGNEWEYEVDMDRPVSPYRSVDQSEVRKQRYVVFGKADSSTTLIAFGEWKQDDTLVRRDTLRIRYNAQSQSYEGWQEHTGIFYYSGMLSPGLYFGPPITDERTSERLFNGRTVTVSLFGNFVYGFWAAREIGIVDGAGGCEPCSVFDDRDSWTLQYARVSGDVYGARIVSVPATAALARDALRVYPNPSRGRVTVETLVGDRITVHDLLGREVHADYTTSARHTLDLRSLSAGIYLVRSQATGAVHRMVLR